MAKIALITGITGQDGAVLARFLLEKGYDVHGLRPYSAVPDEGRLSDISDDIHLHYADMTDTSSLLRLVETYQPDEIYNLAAMSHVHVSFDMPELTANVNALGTLRLLEVLRIMGPQSGMRMYQASSSEMFGHAPAPQNENTSFEPCSPYGTSKLFGYWSVRNYREAYGLHASNGILFNHESPLRGEEFVTRKIIKAVCEIEAGQRDKILLGNLHAKRDWGHARDYMRGAWMMLQQDIPDDYVLATGQARSVKEFVEAAFSYIGRRIDWRGQGVDEKGYDSKTGACLVEVDPALFRPTEVRHLLGDASRAKEILGWEPEISFEQLVEEMMEADRVLPYGQTTKRYAA